MVILFYFPVPLSTADTYKISFASIEKETSIYGTPLAAGGIPSSLNSPRMWLSFVIIYSPSYT
jgi:hypothetical protein